MDRIYKAFGLLLTGPRLSRGDPGDPSLKDSDGLSGPKVLEIHGIIIKGLDPRVCELLSELAQG